MELNQVTIRGRKTYAEFTLEINLKDNKPLISVTGAMDRELFVENKFGVR